MKKGFDVVTPKKEEEKGAKKGEKKRKRKNKDKTNIGISTKTPRGHGGRSFPPPNPGLAAPEALSDMGLSLAEISGSVGMDRGVRCAFGVSPTVHPMDTLFNKQVG